MKTKNLNEILNKTNCSLLAVLYMLTLCPFSVIAEEKRQEVYKLPGQAVVQKELALAEEKTSSLLINATEGGTVTLGEASIQIPPNALSTDTQISITHMRKVADTGESLYNAIPNFRGYRFLPKGTQFQKECVVTLPYDSMLNSKPQSLEELYTYFYDTTEKTWVKLERIEVDKEQCVVRSKTTHFTDMINATLTLPESATPVDVNLNSIKNLEAAKPDSHLINFNPPKASSFGDASFSFDLELSVGRRSMQPQVSVSYSSGLANGIMGKGFDINFGSVITTDTRLGLPSYDTNDTYLLDGVKLEKISSSGNIIEYKPLKQTSFEKIVRYNAEETKDYWQVTSKDGTKRIYENTEKSCIKAGQNKTFTWNVTKVIDMYGNNVIYEYEKDSGYVYIKEIFYTGKDDKKGNYSVKFNYDENGIVRQDIRSDARSKSVVICKKLLTSITTHYKKGDAIRTYSFEYKEGLATEKMLTSLTVYNKGKEESYTYEFEYNEPKVDDKGNIVYFDNVKEWKNERPIQTGSSKSLGTDFNAAAGVGVGTSVVDVRVTGGAGGSFGKGESFTESLLLDIDGDGKVDSVSQKENGELEVHINSGKGGFSSKELPVKLNYDIKRIDEEENSSNTIGWNVYGGAGVKGGLVSFSLGTAYSQVKQNSSTTTSFAFMDMNGDGLVDIVESGKSTYLQNKGKQNGELVFERADIISNNPGAFKDVVRVLSDEQKAEYEKTYFVQTPFRMWKAPFEGEITVIEKAQIIEESFNSQNEVFAKTYIGNENQADQNLLMKVSNAQKKEDSKKDGLKVEKGKSLYFITEHGNEPKNTDVEFEVEINYDSAKVFKKDIPIPLFAEAKLPQSKIYTFKENNYLYESIEEKGKKIFCKEYDFEDIIIDLYQFTDISENNDYQCQVTYKTNWKNNSNLTIDQKNDIINYLIKKNYVIPTVLTSSQMNKYLEQLEQNVVNLSPNYMTSKDFKDYPDGSVKRKYFTEFTNYFIYSASDDLYYFRELNGITPSEKNKILTTFITNYPMSEELFAEVLQNYDIEQKNEGFEKNLEKDKILYSKTESIDINDKERQNEKIGTLFNIKTTETLRKYVNIGKIEDKILLLDLDENKLCSYEDNNVKEIELDYEIIDFSQYEADKKIKFTFLVNKDKDNKEESVINFNLKNVSYAPYNLTEDEFTQIVDSINVEHTNVKEDFWCDEEKLKERKLEVCELLDASCITIEEKESFISLMYDKKDVYSRRNPEVIRFSYYVLKENPNYEEAQKILDEYKLNHVKKIDFPYYDYVEENCEYVLKNEYPDKDELEKITSICKEFGFGKCSQFQINQILNNEHLYQINENSEYTMLNAEVLSENICLSYKTYTLPKTIWNTTQDYKNENKNVGVTVYICDENDFGLVDETKAPTGENKILLNGETICFPTIDFLYGGNENFYYGIWKEKVSLFNEPKLKEFMSNTNNASYSQDDEEKLEKEMSSSANKVKTNTSNSNTSSENKVHFYLPSKQNVITEEEIQNKNLVNSGTQDKCVMNNAIVGTVAFENNRSKDYYYMPFIYESRIHTDRVGGNTYYSIEGLYKEEKTQSGNVMSFPSIRKTRTEGTDITPSISGGGDFTTPSKLPENFESNQNYKDVTGNGGFGINKTDGSNESETKTEQSIQDINGDGIPDVLKIENCVLNVTYGNRPNSSNDAVIYNDYATSFNNITTVAFTNTNVAHRGFSTSLSGGVNILTVKNKVQTTQSPSASYGGGNTASWGSVVQSKGFIDFNGDGLADYYDDNKISINIGDSFISSQKEVLNWDTKSLSFSESRTFGRNATLGKSFGGSSTYSASSLSSGANTNVGGSYSTSSSNTTRMLTDINGDGLVDEVSMNVGSNVLRIRYNTGSSFTQSYEVELPKWEESSFTFNFNEFEGPSNDTLSQGVQIIGTFIEKLGVVKNDFTDIKYANSLDWNESLSLGISGNLGANVNISIPVWFLKLNITANGGAGVNANSTINGMSVKMLDLDGDGLLDHVLKIPNGAMYWKQNISGEYGLLKTVRLPQGGKCELEYAEQYGTTECPLFKRVLSSVTMSDGVGENLPDAATGEHSITESYEYEKGYYDRATKDFYGYGIVKTKRSNGTYCVQEFANKEYYSKGVCTQTLVYKDSTNLGQENLLSKTITTLCAAPIALPEVEENYIYETNSYGEEIYTKTQYNYDSFGNTIRIEQTFDKNKTLIANIDYDYSKENSYIVNLPSLIEVYDQNGTLFIKRNGEYGSKGELKKLRQFSSLYNYSENTLTYDEYGNIKTVTEPRGATLTYEYDSDENMFVIKVIQRGKDVESLTSTIEYDTETQTKLNETDCNENTMSYVYDSWQRIKEIRTPYDNGNHPSVSYEYFTPNVNRITNDENSFWHAITKNKVIFDEEDETTITTVLQVDGLGRSIRTAKTGLVYDENIQQKVLGWNVSGTVERDKAGRPVKESMTEFVAGSLEDLLETQISIGELYTTYEYDSKDRVIQTTLPDQSVTTNEYSIKDGKFLTYTTDSLNNSSEVIKDSRENIVKVSRFDQEGKQLTTARYEYNIMSEMLSAFDAEENEIKATYDLLGRRTELESKDSGRQTFFYDESNNLIRETNSVLREKSQQISYEYDGFNRLVKINYPFTEDTIYTYGKPSDAEINAVGKILKVEDASGYTSYEYGKLGETTKENRTIYTHLHIGDKKETAITQYRSDYLGRMQHIIYPDGEKVEYGYDEGGQVTSVKGYHFSNEFVYVKDIAYDEYGQRVYIEYGNGVKTDYSYDKERRWLSLIKTINENGQTFQNITYNFDTVGNVLGYQNECSTFKTSQNYSYDALYQLTSATGKTVYDPYHSIEPEYISTYNQDFTFDESGLGNMTNKVSTERTSPNVRIGDDLSYNIDYVYDENYAHRLKRAGTRFYEYDSNGNITAEYDRRTTEEIDEPEQDERYIHTIREVAEGVEAVDYGWGLFKEDDKITTKYGLHKRTYNWNERNLLTSSIDSIHTVNYVYGQDGDRCNKFTQSTETVYFSKLWTLHTDSGNRIYGGQTAKNIYLGDSRIVTKLNSADRPTLGEENSKQYYYHSDHLGSATMISDYKGDEYQRIEYTPYGELWVEKTTNTGNEFLPYKFTGKEMDEETGLYYYGARYLDPKYSRWLSTDPALSDYMAGQSNGSSGGIYNTININLYHYASNNPINYTDPTGMESGCLTDSEAVGGMGHSAMYVETYDDKGNSTGFDLYEIGAQLFNGEKWIGDVGKNASVVAESMSHDKLDPRMGEVVGNISGSLGSNINLVMGPLSDIAVSGIASSILNNLDVCAGVSVRHYKDFDKMKDALENQRYDTVLRFNTTKDQDIAIKNQAFQSGQNFGKYNLFSNNCTQHASKALAAGGINTTQFLVPNVATSILKNRYKNNSFVKLGW